MPPTGTLESIGLVRPERPDSGIRQCRTQGGMDSRRNRCNDSRPCGLPRGRDKLLFRPCFKERLPGVGGLDTVHGLP